MKTELAQKLIADKMSWDDARAATELTYLKLMVDYKYDNYQGYQAGSRFYLALLGWLSQFKTSAEREIAYDFLKTRLIFVSQREMHHLVSLLMPIVDREIRHEVVNELNVPLYQSWTNRPVANRVALSRTRTLFIALSDGAKIDVFRRYNEGLISNEQVVASSEISDEKWKNLNGDLKKTISKLGLAEEEAYFERICLIDDFTGSGASFVRRDEKNPGQWKGKIQRFYERYKDWIPPVYQTQGRKWPVQIHHHLASANACQQIKTSLQDYEAQQSTFSFTTTVSYELPDHIVINSTADAGLVKILTDYYDKDIEDDHTGEDIWFGYRQSGLPLILDHNTPNNSLALLWASSESPGTAAKVHEMKPLFIRRKRHSSHG